jgi:elongation factor Ts
MTVTAAMVKELREKTGAAMMACKKALEESKGDFEVAIDLLRKAGEAKAAKRADKTAAEGRVVLATNADQSRAFVVEVNSETDFVARDENFVAFAQLLADQGLTAGVNSVANLMALNHHGEALETTRQALVSKLGENIQVRRVALVAEGHIGHYCHGDRIGVLVALDVNNPSLAKDIAMHIAASNPAAVYPEEISKELIEKEKEIFIAQASESGKPMDIIQKMVEGRVSKFLKEISLTCQPFVKNPDQTVAELLTANKAKILRFVRFEVGEGIVKEEANFAEEVMAQVQGKH